MSSYYTPVVLKSVTGGDFDGAPLTTPWFDFQEWLVFHFTPATNANTANSSGVKYQFKTGVSILGFKLYIPDNNTHNITVQLWDNGVSVRSESVSYNTQGFKTGTFTGGVLSTDSSHVYAVTIRGGGGQTTGVGNTGAHPLPFGAEGAQARSPIGPGIDFLGTWTTGSGAVYPTTLTSTWYMIDAVWSATVV